jgi:RNA polymerase sigma factor (TIGR02999 family)
MSFGLRVHYVMLRTSHDLATRVPGTSTVQRSITQLLEAWRQGDGQAADALFAILYDDLRSLARRQLAALRAGQTLAPTALVHEAYMKFAERSAPALADRSHFFAVAARAMRHVVVDYVRRRRADKRDPKAPMLTLDREDPAADGASPIDLIAMHEALTQLETLDRRQARIVELRFFAGLELEDIAKELDVSDRTVKRDWRKARSYLYHALSQPVP